MIGWILVLFIPLARSYEIYEVTADRQTTIDGVFLPRFAIKWNNSTEGLTEDEKIEMFRNWSQKSVNKLHAEGKVHATDYRKEMTCYPGPPPTETSESGEFPSIPSCLELLSLANEVTDETGDFLKEMENGEQSLSSADSQLVMTFVKETDRLRQLRAALPTATGEFGDKIDKMISKSRAMVASLNSSQLAELNSMLPKGRGKVGAPPGRYDTLDRSENRTRRPDHTRRPRPDMMVTLCEIVHDLQNAPESTKSKVDEVLLSASDGSSGRSDQYILCNFTNNVEKTLAPLVSTTTDKLRDQHHLHLPKIKYHLCNSSDEDARLPLPAKLLADGLRSGTITLNSSIVLCDSIQQISGDAKGRSKNHSGSGIDWSQLENSGWLEQLHLNTSNQTEIKAKIQEISGIDLSQIAGNSPLIASLLKTKGAADLLNSLPRNTSGGIQLPDGAPAELLNRLQGYPVEQFRDLKPKNGTNMLDRFRNVTGGNNNNLPVELLKRTDGPPSRKNAEMADRLPDISIGNISIPEGLKDIFNGERRPATSAPAATQSPTVKFAPLIRNADEFLNISSSKDNDMSTTDKISGIVDAVKNGNGTVIQNIASALGQKVTAADSNTISTLLKKMGGSDLANTIKKVVGGGESSSGQLQTALKDVDIDALKTQFMNYF